MLPPSKTSSSAGRGSPVLIFCESWDDSEARVDELNYAEPTVKCPDTDEEGNWENNEKKSSWHIFWGVDAARKRERERVERKCSVTFQCSTRSGRVTSFLAPYSMFLFPVALNSMEITTDADFYWISKGLMNVSLNYCRKEGFYAVFAWTQALAALTTRQRARRIRIQARSPVIVWYQHATRTGREYWLFCAFKVTHVNTFLAFRIKHQE